MKEKVTYFAIIHWDGVGYCWSIHRKAKDGRITNIGVVGCAQFPTPKEACELFRSQNREKDAGESFMEWYCGSPS